jgi:hypothetical protein
MVKLDVVDGLKAVHVDVFVDGFELDGLLVLVELYVPLLLVFGVGFGVGTPVCHAQSRVCQSGVTS